MSGCPAKKIITVGAVIAIIALLFPFSVSCSKPPPPIAAFTVSYVSGEILMEDPIAGLAPLTVRFSDQSTGNISSWRWSLGDGTVVEDERDFVHTYKTTNSSGYSISLAVRGPGGKGEEVERGLVAVFSCSEAANVELNQARDAIEALIQAAGKPPAPVTVWDGSRGKVAAGGRDAADYLGVWKTFKAVYDVDANENGYITVGTDVSWGCVFWDSTKVPKARWVGK